MISTIACLEDNYAYIVESDGRLAIVDSSDEAPVIAALKGRKIDEIWATHHHLDHVGGIEALMVRFPDVIVRSSEVDRTRIPGVTDVSESFKFGDSMVRALATPGHTLGALTYVFEDAAFTGDTLFAAGCGRLFEGTAEMMFESFARITALPDDTRIFCGHEYYLSNLRFAASEGLNVATETGAAKEKRDLGEPTVPTTLADERRTNVFVRAKSAEEFAALRQRKNDFRG